jgi:hypothetical protein
MRRRAAAAAAAAQQQSRRPRQPQPQPAQASPQHPVPVEDWFGSGGLAPAYDPFGRPHRSAQRPVVYDRRPQGGGGFGFPGSYYGGSGGYPGGGYRVSPFGGLW